MEQSNQVVLTPKVIAKGVLDFFKMFKRNWLAIVVFILLGLGVGFYFEIDKPQHKRYISNVTFNMSNANQQQMGFGMGDFAAMMGLGGNANGNLFTGENFLYLAKSKPVIERAMLKTIKVKGKPTLFVNYYMDSSFIVKDFLIKELFDYEHRFKVDNRDSMTVIERLLFDRILDEIQFETEIVPLSDKTTIVRMSPSMTNEMLCKTWADLMLEAIEDLYKENQNKKAYETLDIMKKRVEKLGRRLESYEGQLARVTDLNQEAVGVQGIIDQGRLTRKTGFEQAQYLEASKAYETMKLNLEREAPLFTVIEPPRLPLDIQYYMPSRAIFGALIGFLVGFLFVVFRESFKAALASDKSKKVEN